MNRVPPPQSRLPLRALLASDLAARHPGAEHWSWWRVARTFVGDPAMRAVLVFRLVSRSPGRGVFWWRPWLVWLARSEIYSCEAGKGLQLDGLHGTVIAQGVVMGEGVHLHSGVTLGTARAPEPGMMLPTPFLADRVTVESGTVIGGAITIGADSYIEHDCVVARDVPAGTRVPAGTFR